MVCQRALPFGFVIAFCGLPVLAGELDAFVSARDGEISCWSRIYDDEHLARHKQQTVTDMALAVGYIAETKNYASLYWFRLEASQRGGNSGVTSGSCYPDGDDMACVVDCDGGRVVVSTRDGGDVLLDLERYGYLRMQSSCGAETEEAGFRLEAGIDDKEFLLHQVTGPQCEALRPDWL